MEFFCLRILGPQQLSLQVSVKTEFPCPSGTNEWDSLKPVCVNGGETLCFWKLTTKAYTYFQASSTSDWQVSFQRPEEQLLPMNLTQARKLGYVFDLLLDRIVFRTPYGQHESYNTKVNLLAGLMVYKLFL